VAPETAFHTSATDVPVVPVTRNPVGASGAAVAGRAVPGR
jgi:hypothetical protein